MHTYKIPLIELMNNSTPNSIHRATNRKKNTLGAKIEHSHSP